MPDPQLALFAEDDRPEGLRYQPEFITPDEERALAARFALQAQPRSLYRLDGAARNEWEHSIPPVEALRRSITFRTLRDA